MMKKQLVKYTRTIITSDGEDSQSYTMFLNYFDSFKNDFTLTGVDENKKTFDILVQIGRDDEVILKAMSEETDSTFYLRKNFTTDCQIKTKLGHKIMVKAITQSFNTKDYLLDIIFTLYDNDKPMDKYHLRIEQL